jgi:hypothetical protein
MDGILVLPGGERKPAARAVGLSGPPASATGPGDEGASALTAFAGPLGVSRFPGSANLVLPIGRDRAPQDDPGQYRTQRHRSGESPQVLGSLELR